MRFLAISFLLVALMAQMGGADNGAVLKLGQVFGSVGFLNPNPAGVMSDAPATVIAFIASDGHRNLVLTGSAGDYVELLEPGHYCIAAYTRKGEPVELSDKQKKCLDVQAGKDHRLDVMLVRHQ
jgi:hypothetical protein